MPWTSHHVVHARYRVIALLLAGVLALQLAAGTGLAYLAGSDRTRTLLAHPHWPWLAVVVGVCEAYRAAPRPFDGTEVTALRVAVDTAVPALLAAYPDHPDGLSDLLSHGHALVDVATGMLADQRAVPLEQAFARLRGHAWAVGCAVDQVAADMVAGNLHLAR